MQKKWIPVIVAIISLLGGSVAVINFQIGDNIWSSETINEGDINIESEGITCEKLQLACKDISKSIDPKIRKYCPMLDIMC